jgi:uncharacterized protein YbjT (DUF2867 family)
VTRRTALLAGASGLVGSECLRVLRAHEDYERVVVLTRRDLGSAVRHPRVRQVIVAFDALPEQADWCAVDHVFCALGTTIRKAGSQARFRQIDFGYPERLARLTRAAGARHFSLVSALGANPHSPFFYSRVKGELEDALRAMDWPSLCLFRPSVIAGDRAESRPFERLAEQALRFAPEALRPVAARHIAGAMVACAGREPPGTTVIESRDIARKAESG